MELVYDDGIFLGTDASVSVSSRDENSSANEDEQLPPTPLPRPSSLASTLTVPPPVMPRQRLESTASARSSAIIDARDAEAHYVAGPPRRASKVSHTSSSSIVIANEAPIYDDGNDAGAARRFTHSQTSSSSLVTANEEHIYALDDEVAVPPRRASQAGGSSVSPLVAAGEGSKNGGGNAGAAGGGNEDEDDDDDDTLPAPPTPVDQPDASSGVAGGGPRAVLEGDARPIVLARAPLRRRSPSHGKADAAVRPARRPLPATPDEPKVTVPLHGQTVTAPLMPTRGEDEDEDSAAAGMYATADTDDIYAEPEFVGASPANRPLPDPPKQPRGNHHPYAHPLGEGGSGRYNRILGDDEEGAPSYASAAAAAQGSAADPPYAKARGIPGVEPGDAAVVVLAGDEGFYGKVAIDGTAVMDRRAAAADVLDEHAYNVLPPAVPVLLPQTAASSEGHATAAAGRGVGYAEDGDEDSGDDYDHLLPPPRAGPPLPPDDDVVDAIEPLRFSRGTSKRGNVRQGSFA